MESRGHEGREDQAEGAQSADGLRRAPAPHRGGRGGPPLAARSAADLRGRPARRRRRSQRDAEAPGARLAGDLGALRSARRAGGAGGVGAPPCALRAAAGVAPPRLAPPAVTPLPRPGRRVPLLGKRPRRPCRHGKGRISSPAASRCPGRQPRSPQTGAPSCRPWCAAPPPAGRAPPGVPPPARRERSAHGRRRRRVGQFLQRTIGRRRHPSLAVPLG